MYPTGKIIEQATIAGFADYLLNAEPNDIENENYEERIKTAYDHCKKVILGYDQNEDSKLMLAMYQLMDEYEKVYMELGLRSGLRFLTDIIGFSHNESIRNEQDDDIYAEMPDRVSL